MVKASLLWRFVVGRTPAFGFSCNSNFFFPFSDQLLESCCWRIRCLWSFSCAETFEVDISNTKKLLDGDRGQKIYEKDIIVVGESGIFPPSDIAYVQDAGVKAVLVGESFVKQKDPAVAIAGLFGKDVSC